MFNKLSTKLDKAILISLIAMVGFNLVMVAQQLDTEPQVAFGRTASHQA